MTKKITATQIRGYLRARFREINNNKKNTNQITMKTFATFALLGLAATAIKLRDDEDGDGWIDQDEFEVGEFAEEIAADLFDVCDADFDGVCTVDEAWDVIDAFDPEDEFEAELSYMTEVIFDNADNWHYWDVKEADGEITFDELATEVQWGLDHNDLEEWLEDANDGEFDYEWMGDWELDWPDCEWDDDACWEEWEA